MKQTTVVFLLCSFYIIAFSVNAPAISQPTGDARFEDALMSRCVAFETTEETGELTPVSSATGALIDASLLAGSTGNPEPLQAAIAQYTEALDLLQGQQLVEECRDALLSRLFYTGWSLLQTLSGGGDPACLTLSTGSIIADILLVLQSYQLCVIDNAEVPDEELRETICRQQKLVKTYDFIAGWLYATRCSYNTSWATYLTLLVNFLLVFPVCT